MRVVVLGAGYAGLTLATELEDRLPAADDLHVVDETGTHLVQHELHRVLRRPAVADDIELSLAEVLDEATTITQARVESVDPDAGAVVLDDGELAYDVAAVCLGARADFQGIEGLAAAATPLKTLEHASAIREEVLEVLAADGRIVVGGAGLSGIQVAGEIAELRRERDSAATIHLLEQADAVAPGFDTAFQQAVRSALAARDVTIRTGATVAGADGDAVALADGSQLAYDTLVWTGGIRGSDAMDGERPAVRSDLRLANRTLALGDAVRVVDDHGEAVPPSARTAMGQARVAAANVETLLAHERERGAGDFAPSLERYATGQPRWLVSVGDGAVAQIGESVITGRAATALKAGVGAGYVGRVGAIREAVDLVRSELGLVPADQE